MRMRKLDFWRGAPQVSTASLGIYVNNPNVTRCGKADIRVAISVEPLAVIYRYRMALE